MIGNISKFRDANKPRKLLLITSKLNCSHGSTTTDREQTDRGQRRLAEKGDPKYIFTIPRAILPKLSLCNETTVTKSSFRGNLLALSLSRSVDLARVHVLHSAHTIYPGTAPPKTECKKKKEINRKAIMILSNSRLIS